MCDYWLGQQCAGWSQESGPTLLQIAKTKGNWDECVIGAGRSNRNIIFITYFSWIYLVLKNKEFFYTEP
jgi:hypothetical protein